MVIHLFCALSKAQSFWDVRSRHRTHHSVISCLSLSGFVSSLSLCALLPLPLLLDMSYQDLFSSRGHPSLLCTIKGSELLGCAINAPNSPYEKIYVLPLLTIKMDKVEPKERARTGRKIPSAAAALRLIARRQALLIALSMLDAPFLVSSLTFWRRFLSIPSVFLEPFPSVLSLFVCPLTMMNRSFAALIPSPSWRRMG